MMLPRLASPLLGTLGSLSSQVRRRGMAAGLLLGLSLAALPARSDGAALLAQDRGPVQRTVHGKVVNKAGAAVGGAVVYLQDEHTSAVKSAIADGEGNFRFVQLAQTTDYLLWAKDNGKKSPNKTISSFDSKNDFVITLKIDE